ncbi:MAG: MFS transporter [Gemmatimonadetes bacterium]|nr:MFS transporter [Gemmatimonadota bacterium]
MSDDRVFTPRFFLMCGYTFTVFFSVFQLLPTAPYRILALGGTTFHSGLFLGALTYVSALTAPVTGALGDRIGQRRMLLIGSLALLVSGAAYAAITNYWLMLVIAGVQGVFWSGLLTASAAYVTANLPVRRRAEGLAYWGIATMLAVATAPTVGFWIYGRGWGWLCLEIVALGVAMALIAWSMTELPLHPREPGERLFSATLLEWRVLGMSLILVLYYFGYGGITSFSALYADSLQVSPRGLYLTAVAVVTLLSRPLAARLGDRLGYKTVLVPCMVLVTLGLTVLALADSRLTMVASAFLFGLGFGTAYPVFVAYVMQHVSPSRRGAAFGAILAALDTGIGTGSTLMGFLIQRYGFPLAFGGAAMLSALAVPYFLVADRKWRVELDRPRSS